MVGRVGERIEHRADRGHLAVPITVSIEQLTALGDGDIFDFDLLHVAAPGEAGSV
jgi:hypothetical protein